MRLRQLVGDLKDVGQNQTWRLLKLKIGTLADELEECIEYAVQKRRGETHEEGKHEDDGQALLGDRGQNGSEVVDILKTGRFGDLSQWHAINEALAGPAHAAVKSGQIVSVSPEVLEAIREFRDILIA